MRTERGRVFEEKEPEFSDEEVITAREEGKIAASFKGKPVATTPESISYIAVKFALHDGSFATLLLDRFSAQLLRSLIETVDNIAWQTAGAIPDATRH